MIYLLLTSLDHFLLIAQKEVIDFCNDLPFADHS